MQIHKINSTYILAFIFNIVVINTLIIFTENFSKYFFPYVLFSSIILFLIFSFFSLFIYFIIKKIDKLNIIDQLILFLLLLSISSGIHSNNLSFDLINSLKITLIIKIFLIFLICYFVNKFNLKIILSYFVFFYIFSFLIIVSLDIFKNIKQSTLSINKNIKVSNKHNIFLLTFDGINNSEIKNILLDNKNKIYFNDFTFFENFYTNSPSSKGSMSFELIGNKFSEFSKVNNNSKLINYVKKDSDNFINKKNLNKNILSYYRTYTDEQRLIDFNIKEFSHLIFLVNERYIRESLIRFFTYKTNTIFSFGSHSYVQSKESFNQYNTYLDKLKNAKNINESVLHAGFWDFTHVPVNFDENCNKLSLAEVKIMQNMQGQVKISKCVTKLMIEFVQILKDKNLYDSSSIIFKSDHGSPSRYFNKEDFRKLSISNSQYGYGRYHPFLLIKNKHTNQLSLNKSIIMNTDIAPYVCNIIETSKNCIKYGDNHIENALNEKEILEERQEIFFIDEGHNKHQMMYLTPFKVLLKNTPVQKKLIEIFGKE